MTDHVDPRIEAAAKALYVAVQPRFRTPEGWDGIAGLWKREYRTHATAAIAAADKAATIATVEELDALPVGSRVVMGDYYILREEHSVDDGVWLDLGNGLRLDADDLRIIIESYPARVIHWGTE